MASDRTTRALLTATNDALSCLDDYGRAGLISPSLWRKMRPILRNCVRLAEQADREHGEAIDDVRTVAA